MSRPVAGPQFCQRFLDALGIDRERKVLSVMIDLRPDELVTVTIVEVPDEPAVEGLVQLVSNYTLVEKEDG